MDERGDEAGHVLPPEGSQRAAITELVARIGRRAGDHMTERQVALLGSIGLLWCLLQKFTSYCIDKIG